ncbi:MAG: hypothetical protein ACOYL3_16070 [Desulfuromonadaceae bacterium]
MSLYSMFKTSDRREKEEGVVLDYGTAKIRIARAGGSNRRYSDLLTKKLRPFKRQLENETMDPDAGTRVMAEVYADTVILGWEGVQNAEGKNLDFNRDNVIKIMTDLPDLFRDIQEQALKMANFREAELDDDRKN